MHATDVSNACRTLLYNLKSGEWDPDLLALFDIPASLLPEVRPTSFDFGRTTPDLLGAAVGIGGMIGDQQSALFGQACLEPGMAKTTYGTGCFLLMNTGPDIVHSEHGLLTTVAWQLDGEPATHAARGQHLHGWRVHPMVAGRAGHHRFCAGGERPRRFGRGQRGSRRGPRLRRDGGADLGSLCPRHHPGVDPGQHRGSYRVGDARRIACQVVDLLHAMEGDSGVRLSEVRVDGGAAASDMLMRIQSDLLDRPVLRPTVLKPRPEVPHSWPD